VFFASQLQSVSLDLHVKPKEKEDIPRIVQALCDNSGATLRELRLTTRNHYAELSPQIPALFQCPQLNRLELPEIMHYARLDGSAFLPVSHSIQELLCPLPIVVQLTAAAPNLRHLSIRHGYRDFATADDLRLISKGCPLLETVDGDPDAVVECLPSFPSLRSFRMHVAAWYDDPFANPEWGNATVETIYFDESDRFDCEVVLPLFRERFPQLQRVIDVEDPSDPEVVWSKE
jgi:hypothetical protein